MEYDPALFGDLFPCLAGGPVELKGPFITDVIFFGVFLLFGPYAFILRHCLFLRIEQGVLVLEVRRLDFGPCAAIPN